jgi:oligopeptide transport system ATP-binding protein
MSEHFLEVENLTKYFPVKINGKRAVLKAVDGLSFFIDKGTTLGLVGESGCGKSTTGRLIINLIQPTAGDVRLEGKSVYAARGAEQKALRCRMQIIFQDPYSSLDPRMKVRDILAEPLHIHHLAKGQAVDKRIRQLLDYVGLSWYHVDRFPHEFSGGQRQRIGIARALAVEPELIVCDEPVSALDVSVQSQVLNLLMDLQRELGLTYLFIAHGLNVVKLISDQVGVMYLGHLMELTSSSELYRNPRNPYTQALLSSIPIPDPTVKRERIILPGQVPSPVNTPPGCPFQGRCWLAGKPCAISRPELREFGPGNYVACHMAGGE